MAKKKTSIGRPTDYKPEYDEQARKLCLLGYTNQQLADFFNVDVSTLERWMKKEHFRGAIKSGREFADSQVVDSLYNRARGYVGKEVKTATHEGVITDVKVVDKHIPPDPTSMIFWLKNRQPEMWREKRQESPNESAKNLLTAMLEQLDGKNTDLPNE